MHECCSVSKQAESMDKWGVPDLVFAGCVFSVSSLLVPSCSGSMCEPNVLQRGREVWVIVKQFVVTETAQAHCQRYLNLKWGAIINPLLTRRSPIDE